MEFANQLLVKRYSRNITDYSINSTVRTERSLLQGGLYDKVIHLRCAINLLTAKASATRGCFHILTIGRAMSVYLVQSLIVRRRNRCRGQIPEKNNW